MGKCKQCKVKIVKNDGKEEEVLGCQYKIQEDLIVKIPIKEERHAILVEGLQRKVDIDPLAKKIYIELPPPSLKDNRDDWTRLGGKKGIKANINMLRDLPKKIRDNDFKVTITRIGEQAIAIEGQDTRKTLLGMAFDIGTTTIAGYLIDLKTGVELTRVSSLNTQTQHGADLVSRVMYAAESPGGLDRLHGEVIKKLNELIKLAVKQTKFKPQDIYAITAVGNTVMHHLLFKIQPESLIRAPYVPVVIEPIVIDAKEIKIEINSSGKLFGFPNIAGFVGGDTVAAILAAEIHSAKDLKLLIDIGTNGEIVLGKKGRCLACSTAAGPAFEGVEISCGMRGAAGAIDHVVIDEKYKYTVIGEVLPLGIAGSGLVDVMSELVKIGIINKKGRILKPEEVENKLGGKHKDKITIINDITSFILENKTQTGQPVYINQKDIREFQLAKGAIAAGIEILLKEYGAKVEDISEVFLAGAFGNYLDSKSACQVGLIPKELEDKINGIGNAAGVGAKLAIISEKEYNRAVDFYREIDYIELSTHPNFTSIFLEKIEF